MSFPPPALVRTGSSGSAAGGGGGGGSFGGPTYVVGQGQALSVAVPSTPSGGGAAAAAGTPGGKRRAADAQLPSEHDYLEFTPLGAGCEVGRSCHILKFKGRTIMLDAGLHPAYVGVSSLPFFDEIDPKLVDLLLVSHFHLDHAAALPYFLEKTDFAGACYMTHPTRSIYKLILQDYLKVSNLGVEDVLYTEADLLSSLSKIDVLNFHETVHYKGIKFTALNAGHVLGAAMFLIEIGGVRVLYTGDYSRREDRHLMSAEMPTEAVDVLVVEATYGIQRLPPVAEREQRFTELVREIVEVRRGKVLLPVFALGRAQELLLILDEYWAANPALHSIPIYYASALAKKTMGVYQTYINMMNKRIQAAAQVSNPFHFRHVLNLRASPEALEDAGPCVVMASPGMLQNGLSRELLEMWAPDAENGVVLTGYATEGTLAKYLISEPSHIQTLSGTRVPLHASVAYISFSAHADFTETSEFIELLRPRHVILVHGDASEGVGRLRYALESRYTSGEMRVVAPRNCQSVALCFRAAKVAKTVGSLAARPPADGQALQGLLVRKHFTEYTLMAAEELPAFTPLQATTVRQQLKLPFHQTFQCMRFFVGQMYELHDQDLGQGEHKQDATGAGTDERKDGGATESKAASGPDAKKAERDGEVEMKDAASADGKAASSNGDASAAAPSTAADSSQTILVHGCVLLSYKATPTAHVVVSWESNPVADMLSDSLVALLTNLHANPGAARIIGAAGGCRNAHATGGGGGHGHGHAHGPPKQHRHQQGHTESEHDHTACAHTAHAADAAAAIAAGLDSIPAALGPEHARYAQLLKSAPAAERPPSFRWFLEQHYGTALAFDAAANAYRFTLNGTLPCTVLLDTLEVQCADAEHRRRIATTVRRAHAACNPISHVNTTPLRAVEQQDDKTQLKKQEPAANAAQNGTAGASAAAPSSAAAAATTAAPAPASAAVAAAAPQP